MLPCYEYFFGNFIVALIARTLRGNRLKLLNSFKLEKKHIYKWKEKAQKNTGRKRKVQVTKAAFKGLHRFVFFTAESLPCSETQPRK